MYKLINAHCHALAIALGFARVALTASVFGQSPADAIWPRPAIIPKPKSVEGTATPVVSLDGQWKITCDPPADYWKNSVDSTKWQEIKVPAEVAFHLGPSAGIGSTVNELHNPKQRRPDYVYKKEIAVPADFRGKRILLRFEGVTGDAQTWVNGIEVARHHGGFTIWNPDVTAQLKPGDDAWITVAVSEARSGESTNGYTGGIIRGAQLVAVPLDHFTRLHVETDFDEHYRDATLKVSLAAALDGVGEATARLQLTDPSGAIVERASRDVKLTTASPEVAVAIPVAAPQKWDAEHPRLHTLTARLEVAGQIVETIERKFGFRKVQVDGRRLLVNGSEVKLRGSGQFDSDPLDGISLSAEEAARDVLLYKQCNHNFVRPACYPASEAFLGACDRIGLYVEGEMPVTFAYEAANTSALTPLFLSQAAETVEQDSSHPSIIMWDLANETGYGVNIRKTSEYVHAADATRPVVFSWSHSVTPTDPLPYEIFSYHYPPFDADLGRPGVAIFNSGKLNRAIPPMPVLADEFAHPSSYNYEEMRRDPNVRNFWGEGIKKFWERMFTTEGSLGGAIWAGVDHPMDRVRVYPWGLLDKWRRPKPEYWLTKKAYSPVRIPDHPVRRPGAGQPLKLPVSNWFDHTNLAEISFSWSVGAEHGSFAGPNVGPHCPGEIEIPRRAWKAGDVIHIEVHAADGMMLDEYNLAADPLAISFPGVQGPAPSVREGASQYSIDGDDFHLAFSKKTGKVISGTYRNAALLIGGPELHIGGVELSDWSLTNLSVDREKDQAVVRLAGVYQALSEAQANPRNRGPQPPKLPKAGLVEVEVRFEVRIDGHGLINTVCRLDRFPIASPPTRLVPWNDTSAGGFEEVGLQYILSGNIDRLAWSRKGLWSAYPEDHIGRNVGVAMRTGPGTAGEVGVKPTWPWSQDERDFNLFGPRDAGGRGTNDFRSMKENIEFASASIMGASAAVRVESNGADAVRLEMVNPTPTSEIRLLILSGWNYRNLGLGNSMKSPVVAETGRALTATMRLTSHAELPYD